jgi:hypothetical protein|tara:strand:+ start:445 stop:648 length:204 start_codon:yes stop_codon:yes gene_type:complete
VQELIQKKRDAKNSRMTAKISNKFINQICIFTLINKQFIQETLQKEYQNKLDAELYELDNMVNVPNY